MNFQEAFFIKNTLAQEDNILSFNEDIIENIKFIIYLVWNNIVRNVQGKPIQKKNATLAIKISMTK